MARRSRGRAPAVPARPGHRPKPLHVRGWTCQGCGTVHDRDQNAAHNTLAPGRADRLNASQSAGKTRTKIPAQRVEAGSHPDGHKTVAGIPGL
ncbi:zinc ribbon domain-containing protein [Actinacidiphila oryziradicis]